ncbi:uncharacterized protein LOC129606517 [Condylostylus longicornis]|uniref:uncharacterized protein LOC129606517 n=1 Tax=Condylostylus longicornis TaxID=2530218 RepID=UPI00244E30EF|nr:uncharacterized protein LOC129606517 [Condylostylus longicornis]
MSLVCVADYETKAKELLEKSALGYYASGAGDEFSLKLNKNIFQKYRLRPRCLVDVSSIDLTCKVLNKTFEWPLGVSPTAMQRMAHPDGEVANARAAGKLGSIFILSTIATTSVEEVAEKAPNTTKWFQLYIYKDRIITENLIRRAEKAGFEALVLTVDAPVFGARRADMRNKFELPSHLSLKNFNGLFANSLNGDSDNEISGINAYVSKQFDPTLTWKSVEWLIKFTKLPVIVKGILTKEDAILAKNYGCSGIIVSNHGARQIDTVPTALEVLPEIVKSVGHELTIMADGGFSNGTDIFKALAMGAKMVFVGRPCLWGLAVDGQNGVESILRILKQDFEKTMRLMGCRKISDISKEMVVHESFYAKL